MAFPLTIFKARRMRHGFIAILTLICLVAGGRDAFARGDEMPAPAHPAMSATAAPALAKTAGILGGWSSVANAPQAFGYNCGAYLNGALFTFSGINPNALKTAYRFDIGLGTWSTLATLPTARMLASAEAINGGVYIFGGYSATSPFTTQAQPLKYDPTANSYTAMAAMPVPVFGAASFIYKDRVYVLGGGTTGFGVYTDAIQIYEPTLNVWTKSTSTIPMTLGLFDAAVIGDNVYLVGGYRVVNNQAVYQAGVYKGTFGSDGNTITWEKKADFPAGYIFAFSMGASASTIYLTGGYDPQSAQEANVASNRTWSYDAATDTWKHEAMKPHGTMFATPMVPDAAGLFHVVAGCPAFTADVVAYTEVFDAAAASTAAAEIPVTSYARWAKRSVTYQTEFPIRSIGGLALEWSATVTGGATWLTLGTASGSLDPGQIDGIGVTITPTALTPGTYTGKITVITNDPKQASVELTVDITVQEQDVEEPLNALVEQYTGTWCQWCPYGADSLAAVSARYGDRMVRTSWHDNDPMQISAWTAMNQWIGVSGFPTACVGRVTWPGQTELPIDRGAWGDAVGYLVNNGASPVSLTISDKNWDAATGTLTFKATIFFHQSMAADLRLTTILTEDDLNYAQKRYNMTTGTVETINPYYHKSVVRAIEPVDVLGLQLSSQNAFTTQATIEKTVTITAPSGFNAAKGHLVVYVHRLTDTQGPGPVQQAHGEPLGVSTSADNAPVAGTFRLHQNYPNPFNPSTTLSYDVPRESVVTIAVYDAFGRLLRTVAEGTHAAGSYSIQLDGAGLASGTYFVTMRAGDFSQTRSMTLMK
jgi:N-acetylneuraminic acid mutarotase